NPIAADYSFRLQSTSVSDTINVGEQKSGSIAEGQIDTYILTLDAPRLLDFDALTRTGDSNLLWTLSGPTDDPVSDGRFYDDEGKSLLHLDEGIYTFTV